MFAYICLYFILELRGDSSCLNDASSLLDCLDNYSIRIVCSLSLSSTFIISISVLSET